MPLRVRSRSGLSLLEILVVTAIGMLLAAILLPASVRWESRRRLDLAATVIAGELRRARLESVSERVRASVKFDPAALSYLAFRDLDGDGLRDVAETLLRASATRLPLGVSYRHPTGQDAIQFDVSTNGCDCAQFLPDGSLVAASPARDPHAVYIGDRYHEFRRIRVSLGGVVRTERWQSGGWG